MSQRKRKRADEVKEEQIELVKELLDEREQAIAHHRPHFSQRQIANIVSKTTGSSISQQSVSRYSSQDMSIEARRRRTRKTSTVEPEAGALAKERSSWNGLLRQSLP